MKYTRAWIEKGYFDERPVLRVRDAAVDISARTILVEWREGPQEYRFEGVRNGQGHFLLRGDNGAASATLHRFENSTILEGYWKLGGTSGFWRVHLPEESMAEVVRLSRAGAPGNARRRKPARRTSVAA